jgi:hypothetical protein
LTCDRTFPRQALQWGFSLTEKGHIPDRRHSSRERASRAAGEVIHPRRLSDLAGGRRQMDMSINRSRQDKFSACVDCLTRFEAATDLHDRFTNDRDIGQI